MMTADPSEHPWHESKRMADRSKRTPVTQQKRAAIAARFLQLQSELEKEHPHSQVPCRILAEEAGVSPSTVAEIIRKVNAGKIDIKKLPTAREEIEFLLKQPRQPPATKEESNRKYHEKRRLILQKAKKNSGESSNPSKWIDLNGVVDLNGAARNGAATDAASKEVDGDDDATSSPFIVPDGTSEGVDTIGVKVPVGMPTTPNCMPTPLPDGVRTPFVVPDGASKGGDANGVTNGIAERSGETNSNVPPTWRQGQKRITDFFLPTGAKRPKRNIRPPPPPLVQTKIDKFLEVMGPKTRSTVRRSQARLRNAFRDKAEDEHGARETKQSGRVRGDGSVAAVLAGMKGHSPTSGKSNAAMTRGKSNAEMMSGERKVPSGRSNTAMMPGDRKATLTCYVSKKFDDGWYWGQVARPAQNERCSLVVYEDGDKEEVALDELARITRNARGHKRLMTKKSAVMLTHQVALYHATESQTDGEKPIAAGSRRLGTKSKRKTQPREEKQVAMKTQPGPTEKPTAATSKLSSKQPAAKLPSATTKQLHGTQLVRAIKAEFGNRVILRPNPPEIRKGAEIQVEWDGILRRAKVTGIVYCWSPVIGEYFYQVHISPVTGMMLPTPTLIVSHSRLGRFTAYSVVDAGLPKAGKSKSASETDIYLTFDRDGLEKAQNTGMHPMFPIPIGTSAASRAALLNDWIANRKGAQRATTEAFPARYFASLEEVLEEAVPPGCISVRREWVRMAGGAKKGDPCFAYRVFLILLVSPATSDRSLHLLFRDFFGEYPTQVSFLQKADEAWQRLKRHLNYGPTKATRCVQGLKIVFREYLLGLFSTIPLGERTEEEMVPAMQGEGGVKLMKTATKLLNRLELDFDTNMKGVKMTGSEARMLVATDMFPAELNESARSLLLALPGVGPKIYALLADTIYGVNGGIPMDCHAERIGVSHELFPLYCPKGNRAATMGLFVRPVDHIRANEVPAGINQLLGQTPEMTVPRKVKLIRDLLRVAKSSGREVGMTRYLFHCLRDAEEDTQDGD
jgi:endonuclease III